jgi:hypothetical protein
METVKIITVNRINIFIESKIKKLTAEDSNVSLAMPKIE